MRRAGLASIRRRPVNSALGLAGGKARVRSAASALRSRSQDPNPRDRHGCLTSCNVACPVQALRAGQGQDSLWQRPRVSCGWRLAPACSAAQSVGGRAARGRPGSSCRRRARGARGRQRFSCQRRCERRCVRGLTGRSTGGATAGRLARVAQCAYSPPRGQGSLPRPPVTSTLGLAGSNARVQRAASALRFRSKTKPTR